MTTDVDTAAVVHASDIIRQRGFIPAHELPRRVDVGVVRAARVPILVVGQRRWEFDGYAVTPVALVTAFVGVYDYGLGGVVPLGPPWYPEWLLVVWEPIEVWPRRDQIAALARIVVRPELLRAILAAAELGADRQSLRALIESGLPNTEA